MPQIAAYNFEQLSGALRDVTGNGNDSTSITGATSRTATGVLGGNAWDFDGTDDYVDVAWPLGSASQASISIWHKADSLGNKPRSGDGRPLVGSGQQEANPQHWHITPSWFTTGGISGGSGYDEGLALDFSSEASAGVWQLVTVTKDNNYYTAYLNGVEVASGTANSSYDQGFKDLGDWPARFGRVVHDHSSFQYDEAFDGVISMAWLHNHVLTPQEVQYLYDVTQHATYTSPKRKL